MATKCISKLAQLRPPSSHDYGLQVHISKVARSWPPSASRKLLDYGVQVYLQTRSNMASRFARSWPPSALTQSLDHGLQGYLQNRSITALKCISIVARLLPPSLYDFSLQVHLQTRLITASEFIFEFTRLSLLGAPRIALKHCLHPVQIYRV